jgi:hypothetical protein
VETRDLGLPVAAIALPDGVPVYDRDDERIGVVEHALIDEVTTIFEGLVIHTHPLPRQGTSSPRRSRSMRCTSAARSCRSPATR